MTVTDALLLVSRLLLAGVFLLAGVTKLRDRSGARHAMRDFGVPDILIAPATIALPVAEITIGAACLATGLARYAGIAALALSLVFLTGMVASLIRGRHPHCHCFGQLYSAPIGWRAIVRNSLLAVIAAFVAVVGWGDAGPSIVAWLVPLTAFQRAAVIAGALAVLLLGAQSALLLAVVRQNQRLLSHLTTTPAAPPPMATPFSEQPTGEATLTAGLPVGSVAPPFALPTLDGNTVTLDMLRAGGKPVILLFSDPNCGPCNALLPEIGRWQREIGDTGVLALVSRDTAEANRAQSSAHRIRHTLLQRDSEVALAYAVIGTPSAALVLPDGTIGRPLAQGADAIRALVAEAARLPAASLPLPVAPSEASTLDGEGTDQTTDPTPAPLRVGDPAPAFTLPDLDGRSAALAHFQGKPTLVLFWNPGCGYCAQMLDDLKAWEQRPQAERAQLLVVASGSAEANRALGLHSTVVLDPTFAVGPHYGVQGTPSAALIDAEGRMAAPIAVGSAAVLTLAGRPASAIALKPDTKPVREGCVRDEFLADGTIVLYHGCRQQTLTLNPTAALVWECCDGEHDIAAIVAEVREIFPDAPDVDGDVGALLATLRQAGMIAAATS